MNFTENICYYTDTAEGGPFKYIIILGTAIGIIAGGCYGFQNQYRYCDASTGIYHPSMLDANLDNCERTTNSIMYAISGGMVSLMGLAPLGIVMNQIFDGVNYLICPQGDPSQI